MIQVFNSICFVPYFILSALVLSNQANDSCPVTQLQFLEKSFLSTYKIQIKQTDKSVAIWIAQNTVLSAEGASQREAAREMVAMLARLIQKQLSLNAGNCQQQTPISSLTVTPTLPISTFTLTPTLTKEAVSLVHNSETANSSSPIVTLSTSSNIATFSLSPTMESQPIESQPIEIQPGAERGSNGKKQRKNVFASLLSKARKLMGSLKKTNLPPQTSQVPEVESLSPLQTEGNFAQTPPLDLSKCELIPSPPASSEKSNPIAWAEAPSASRKSSTLDKFVISKEKLAKRWQLLLDYTQFATEGRTDLEILKHLMEKDGTQFIVTAVPNSRKDTRVIVTISEIHTIEAIASSEKEARAQVLQKTANYVASVAQLVKRFKSLVPLEKITWNAEELVYTLATEFPKLIRITRKSSANKKTRRSPSLNQYRTTVVLMGLAVIPSPLMDNKVASEMAAFIRAIEYMEKLAQFDSAVFSKPVPRSYQPALPLKIKSDLQPLTSLSLEEVARKQAALFRLLGRLVSLPLKLRVNVHQVVKHLNAGSIDQSVPLLLISESSEIVFELTSEKNITIYKTKLELPECLGIFIGASMNKRESRAIASLKVLAFANEWLKLLKYFSFGKLIIEYFYLKRNLIIK